MQLKNLKVNRMNFYQKPVDTIISELKTSAQKGLTDAESIARLKEYGHNHIIRTNKRNMLQVFLELFKNKALCGFLLSSSSILYW